MKKILFVCVMVGMMLSVAGCGKTSNAQEGEGVEQSTEQSQNEAKFERMTQEDFAASLTANLMESPSLGVTEFQSYMERASITHRADLFIVNKETNLPERCGSINLIRYENEETMKGVVLGGGISTVGFFAPYVLKTIGLNEEEITEFMDAMEISNTQKNTNSITMFGLSGDYRFENSTELFVVTYLNE